MSRLPERPAVALAGGGPRDRYALDALLDVLGLRLAAPDEPVSAAVKPDGLGLDEVFASLTLAGEAGAAEDVFGRPLPPDPSPAPPLPGRVEALARRLGARPAQWAGGERFAVALTHDIDALGGGGCVAIARKAVLGITVRPRSAAARRRRTEARAYARDLRAGLDPDFPLGELLAAEREQGRRSTCYFLVRHDRPVDPHGRRYSRRLAAAVAAAAEAGLEIGLHASYAARDRPGALAEEGATLERITGIRPLGMRHHFLRSAPTQLAAELRAAGLAYDSSIGWPSLPGLRAGTPYPYRLWDDERGEPGAWELPLALMDATLAGPHYLGLDADAAYERAVAALAPVRAAGGACALLWHPPYHHPALARGYDSVYRRLVAWIGEQGGFAGTAAEVLERWQTRGLR